MSWYKTGSVNVTNGSPLVVGIGTGWSQTVRQGDTFHGPDRDSYEVLSVGSDLSLTLAEPYRGATLASQPYRISPTQGYVRALTDAVQSLINEFESNLLDPAVTPLMPSDTFTLNQGGITRSASISDLIAAVTGAGGAEKLSRWAFGPATAIPSVQMRIDNLFEESSFPLTAESGIWAESTYAAWAFSQEMGPSTVTGAGGSPLSTMFVYANNNGSAGDVVALMASSIARSPGGTVFGANILARNDAGINGAKLVGMEIDLQPTAGTNISSGSAGFYLNGFNISLPAPAMQVAGVGGGTWQDGFVTSHIRGSHYSVNSSNPTTSQSFIDTRNGAFSENAIRLGVGASQGVRFGNGAFGVSPLIWGESDGTQVLTMGSSGRFEIRLGTGQVVASLSALSGLDMRGASFTGNAIRLGTGASQGISWGSAELGVSPFLFGDSSSNFRAVMGAGKRWVWRNTADTQSLVSIVEDDSGAPLLNIEASNGEIRVAGSRVLGARINGWGLAINGSRAPFDGATATHEQTRAALAALIRDAQLQGWIGVSA